MRNGEEAPIHPDELVVGDIIVITSGLHISADSIVIESNDIMMSEAAITGENDAVAKKPYESCVKMEAEKRPNRKTTGDTKHDVDSPCLLSGT